MRDISDAIKKVKITVAKAIVKEPELKKKTELDNEAKFTFPNLNKLPRSKSPTIKRAVTPSHKKTQVAFTDNTKGAPKTPIGFKKFGKNRSKSKSRDRTQGASGSKKRAKMITGSKYFGNIFGEITAIDYFKEDNKFDDQALSLANHLSPMKLQEVENRKTHLKGTEAKLELPNAVQSEKMIKTPQDDTDFDLFRENSYLLNNPSPNKTLFKSEVQNLNKDQVFDLLLKTSDITKRSGALKSNLANLISSLPIQSLKIQNIKQLLYYSAARSQGISAEIFHKKCDNHGCYLGFVKHQTGMFGFFIEGDFNDEFEVYHTSASNFIFTLSTPYSDRFNCFKVKKGKEQYALCNTEEGFCMGMPTSNNRDLYMNFNDLSKCSSKLGFAYDNGEWPADHLTGRYTDWGITEIEILHIVRFNSLNIRKI